MTLFDDELVCDPPVGLVYREEFISPAEESELVGFIDLQAWDHGYSRRRQFYGQSYRDPAEYTLVPDLFKALALRLYERGLTTVVADHVLINEYLPGQGIAAHVDEMPHPESQVVTISLLDSYPMEFAHLESAQKFEQWLARRSVAVMSGPSKTEWTHEIVKRKADVIQGGGRRTRGRRISITYRTNL
ncbi:MAG TPA: alpha-ketoglutarate-dependent dioxygenase AlkB [Fimbriimonas sp.]|nr:alpha-ketoglutarate-dependent dioxygenase AlkB [Fimbriimonas sp.]